MGEGKEVGAGMCQYDALQALAANIRELEQNKTDARLEWDAIVDDYVTGGGELTPKELKAIATAIAKGTLTDTVDFCDHVSGAAAEFAV